MPLRTQPSLIPLFTWRRAHPLLTSPLVPGSSVRPTSPRLPSGSVSSAILPGEEDLSEGEYSSSLPFPYVVKQIAVTEH